MLGNYSHSENNTAVKDERQHTHSWYFTRDEIDNRSPSRNDGIDRVRESSLRKSYCSFLKDLGIKLQVSPVTTATATMFCHQFYMRQSHAKNDWQTVATACMFLACKVEDNLRPLRDVAIVAYEIVYKWDPSAPKRIRQREVYYKQKELILDGEHLLLVTIGFDINVQHAFRPLVDALKKIKISDNDVAKVAWNLVNEWLRTTLCLQYKPHYIAAGSLSVAAKLLVFKLPMCEGKPWWLQFDVSPKQLEEVTQQMLRFFNHDDGKQKPTSKVEKSNVHQRARSDAVSELTNHPTFTVEVASTSSKLTEEVASASSKPQKPFTGSSHSGQTSTAKASSHRSSDCCSGVSGVIDNSEKNTHTNSNIAPVGNSLAKTDARRAKERGVVATGSGMDSELGCPTVVRKKQKVSEYSRGC